MLSKTLPFVIEFKLPNSTNKKYFYGWRTWADQCNSKQEVDLCLADPFYWALFFNHILFKSGKKDSVITAFYGIRRGHHVKVFNSPTNYLFVQLAFEGCQRLCQSKITKKEPKNKTFKNTRVTFRNSSTKIKNRSTQRRTYCLHFSNLIIMLPSEILRKVCTKNRH